MNIYTKESLIEALKKIAQQEWIENLKLNNHGGIGNTLEALLGIKENNLPIANAAEWELKTQRLNANSLVTLFHLEPSPRAVKFVPQILLLNYGWKHQSAGKRYSEDEMSFRQTIHGLSPTDRGFQIIINHQERKVLISFDSSKVAEKHTKWLKQVENRIGLGQLMPQPYWGFDDLSNKAGTKLLNCFYVQAEVKKEGNKEYYKYSKILMLQKFSFEAFLREVQEGNILVDFDARTGHNHGTKFRIRQNCLPRLYNQTTEIIG